MEQNKLLTTKKITYCAIFTALITIGAFIQIPVPFMDYFTLQFFFVLLAGILLGSKLGALAVLLYVVIGLLGLPIFAAGGGLAYIVRPSFGYLIGFIAGAYVTGWVMSIGKKLLSLRQEKGISQEALGRELNVSRQTVSKWESDLSLPDMKMMITISQFYEISITQLLDLDDETEADSINKIYEQTSLVLENLQKENKKKIIRDWIIIIICTLCLCVALAILVKKGTNEVVFYPNNSTTPITDNNIIDYSNTTFKVISYDFDKMTMSINYKCVLNNYTDITQVNICIVDVFNNQSIYPMTKENAYTFVLTETIPLVNYANFEILVKNGDKGEKINADSEIEHHLDNLLSHLIYIYIPGDKNYKLIRNNMIYKLDYSYLENEKIDYSGTLSNKVEIIINKIKNNNYEKIGQTNTTLDKQKKDKIIKRLI